MRDFLTKVGLIGLNKPEIASVADVMSFVDNGNPKPSLNPPKLDCSDVRVSLWNRQLCDLLVDEFQEMVRKGAYKKLNFNPETMSVAALRDKFHRRLYDMQKTIRQNTQAETSEADRLALQGAREENKGYKRRNQRRGTVGLSFA